MSINATDLRYGSAKHAKIADALVARVDYWKDQYSDKLDRLAKDDDIFTAYVKETAETAQRKQNREDTPAGWRFPHLFAPLSNMYHLLS